MKKLFCTLLLGLLFNLSNAQMTIKKDYMKNGQRIIELEYNGLPYSLLLDFNDYNGVNRLSFRNLGLNKVLSMTIDKANYEKLISIVYNNQELMKVSYGRGGLQFNKNQEGLDGNDERDIQAFGEIMDNLDADWPPSEPGRERASNNWEIIDVTFGGTRSLAEARCGQSQERAIESADKCVNTVDCDCLMGDFACFCVCGRICEDD